MNIKKLASLVFRRSVIVALLILLQVILLLGVLALSSAGYAYIYWGCVVLSVLAVLVIVSRQTDPGYKIAWIIPILIFPAFGWLVYLLCGGNKLSARLRRKMQGMDRAMLESAADGVTLIDCVDVHFRPDVDPELIRRRLVGVVDCVNVLCSAEQRSAVELVSENVVTIGEDKEEGGILSLLRGKRGEKTVNAVHYKL